MCWVLWWHLLKMISLDSGHDTGSRGPLAYPTEATQSLSVSFRVARWSGAGPPFRRWDRPEIKVPAHSVRSPLPGSLPTVFSLCPHTEPEARELCRGPLHEGTDPIHGASSSWPTGLPEAPPPNILGVRISPWKSFRGGHKYFIYSIIVLITFPLKIIKF